MHIRKLTLVIVLISFFDIEVLLCVSCNHSGLKRTTVKENMGETPKHCDTKRTYRFMESISSWNGRQYMDLSRNNEKDIAARLEIAQKVIRREKLEHVHILLKGRYLSEFKHGLAIDDCILRYMDIDNIGLTIREVLNKTQVQHIEEQRRTLNFILIDNANRLNETMKHMKEIDTSHYNSILRHFSRWLLLPIDDEDIVPNGFDNVAMIRCNHVLDYPSHLMTAGDNYCNSYATFTSEWENTGPVFNSLAIVKTFALSSHMWDLFPNVKYGLNGRRIRLTITQWNPYAIKVTGVNTTTFIGVCPNIIQILANTFNFTYYFQEPADGQWGQVENGRWTGQIGDVHRKVADMTGSWLGKDYHRIQAADFAVTLRFSPYAIVYYRRLEEKPFIALVRQFKSEVYIYGLFVFFGIFCFFLLHEFSWQKKRRRKLLNLVNWMQTMGKILLLMTAISLRQGISNLPRHCSDRVLMATLWIFTLIITAIYCGNLIAFRAVARDTRRFRTLSEMLNQKDMIIGFEGKSMLENLLKRTEDKELMLLWTRVTEARSTDPSVTGTSQAEHVKRVYADENYGYITALMVLPSITAHDCRILKLDQTFLTSPYTFAFPQNSPLAKLFDKKLLDLLENGVIDKMVRESFPREQCPDEPNKAKAMFLADYLSVFIALGVALVIGTIILIFELLLASDVLKLCSNQMANK